MQKNAIPLSPASTGAPWNKGKLIGAKPPLRQKHVWAIRGMLQNGRNRRDLAMFNLAIDSKLRGCDVVAIKVEDVAPNGYAVDRATVCQRKTGHPVRFELTKHTRQAIDAYLKSSRKKPGEFLFTGPRSGRSMSPRQYGRLVSADGYWARSALVRHALFAANYGDAHLPPHRESASCAASARPHQDREHRSVSLHRCG